MTDNGADARVVGALVEQLRDQGRRCVLVVTDDASGGGCRAVVTEVATRLGGHVKVVPWVPVNTRLGVPKMTAFAYARDADAAPPLHAPDSAGPVDVLLYVDAADVAHVANNIKGGCGKLCHTIQELANATNESASAGAARRALVLECHAPDVGARALRLLRDAVGGDEAVVRSSPASPPPLHPHPRRRPSGRLRDEVSAMEGGRAGGARARGGLAGAAAQAGQAAQVAGRALVAARLMARSLDDQYGDATGGKIADAIVACNERWTPDRLP